MGAFCLKIYHWELALCSENFTVLYHPLSETYYRVGAVFGRACKALMFFFWNFQQTALAETVATESVLFVKNDLLRSFLRWLALLISNCSVDKFYFYYANVTHDNGNGSTNIPPARKYFIEALKPAVDLVHILFSSAEDFNADIVLKEINRVANSNETIDVTNTLKFTFSVFVIDGGVWREWLECKAGQFFILSSSQDQKKWVIPQLPRGWRAAASLPPYIRLVTWSYPLLLALCHTSSQPKFLLEDLIFLSSSNTEAFYASGTKPIRTRTRHNDFVFSRPWYHSAFQLFKSNFPGAYRLDLSDFCINTTMGSRSITFQIFGRRKFFFGELLAKKIHFLVFF